MKIFDAYLFPKEIIWNYKMFSTKKCFLKILGSFPEENDFATITNFRSKKFWCKCLVLIIPEEMILQP
jgi:hypothetical protein